MFSIFNLNVAGICNMKLWIWGMGKKKTSDSVVYMIPSEKRQFCLFASTIKNKPGEFTPQTSG